LGEAVPDTLIGWDGHKFDVGKFADLWTKQMGYPVISVKRVDEHRVELNQRRFKLDEEALEDPKFRNPQFWYKW
jgi:aminopeptidase N